MLSRVPIAVALILLLTACTQATGAPPPASGTASASDSAPPTATATSSVGTGTMDGDYVFSVLPDTCPTQLAGRTMTIADGEASYVMVTGNTMRGPVSTAVDGTVTIDLRLGDPVTDGVKLTGTVPADGTITGDGLNYGIHPGGETGYSCQFTFTLVRGAAGAVDSDANCSRAALQTEVDASLPGLNAMVAADGIRCSDGWAVAYVTIPGQAPFPNLVVWRNGAWSGIELDSACGPDGAPDELKQLACTGG